jgi:hypothetical protein
MPESVKIRIKQNQGNCDLIEIWDHTKPIIYAVVNRSLFDTIPGLGDLIATSDEVFFRLTPVAAKHNKLINFISKRRGLDI